MLYVHAKRNEIHKHRAFIKYNPKTHLVSIAIGKGIYARPFPLAKAELAHLKVGHREHGCTWTKELCMAKCNSCQNTVSTYTMKAEQAAIQRNFAIPPKVKECGTLLLSYDTHNGE